jgi:hypothetical protein
MLQPLPAVCVCCLTNIACSLPCCLPALVAVVLHCCLLSLCIACCLSLCHEHYLLQIAPVNVDDYDPMADPKRRARSNDPRWKYGYWTEIGNRDKVTCNLCQSVTTGGIKRLKEHLAGGYADAIMCSKTTTEIRKEMRAYLKKNKRTRPIFLDDDDGGHGQQQQEEEGQVGDSSEKTVVQPSSRTAAKRRAIFEGRNSAAAAPKNNPNESPNVASKLQRTPEQVVDDRRASVSHQTTIEATTKSKADRNYVNTAMGFVVL